MTEAIIAEAFRRALLGVMSISHENRHVTGGQQAHRMKIPVAFPY
jgi:hypothetical protein